MKLIIMLFALGLDRFLNVGSMLMRFNWFSAYTHFAQQQLDKFKIDNQMNGWLRTLATILPIPVVVGLVVAIFGGILNGLIGVILNTIVLLYCLGPEDLYKQAHDHPAQGQGVLSTSRIFIEANQRIFAVLFWFFLLGAFGAVLYRVTSLLARNNGHNGAQIKLVKEILDWLPVRVFALVFALVGEFAKGFGYWIDSVISGVEANDSIITEAGAIALQGRTDTASALVVVDRALIVYMVLVLVFSLGAFIY